MFPKRRPQNNSKRNGKQITCRSQKDDQEIDPLDAFMKGIDDEVNNPQAQESSSNSHPLEVMEKEEVDYAQLVDGERNPVEETSSKSRSPSFSPCSYLRRGWKPPSEQENGGQPDHSRPPREQL